jgi:Undecaprenyl-phosphate galactose phosphotransferase WbaP
MISSVLSNQISKSAASGRKRRKRSMVGANAGTLMFATDTFALFAAYVAAVPLSAFLAIDLMGHVEAVEFYTGAQQHTNIYWTLCVAGLMIFFSKGHYTQRVPWWTQIQHISKLIVLAILLDGFLSYALELYYSRALILSSWSCAFAFLLLSRLVQNVVKSRSASWKLPTVIIGGSSTVLDVLFAFQADPGTGYETHTVLLRDRENFHLDRDELPPKYKNLTVMDGRNESIDFIKNNPDNFYIVSLDSYRGEKQDKLIRTFTRNGVQFALIPAVKSFYNMEPRYFFGNDVMLMRARPVTIPLLGRIMKRALDIFVSLSALIAFAPVFIIAVTMLKLEGQGGTPFYGGYRIGRNGRPFRCWKFRTMQPDSDHLFHAYLEEHPEERVKWDKYQKLENDPRVTTKTAAIIRKTSIDEIPQLWNVLKGDMSIVGPRPALEHEMQKFGDREDEYLSVKPGITGLWQVSGRSGVSFERRVRWDSWYVHNWSFWGDIVIILKTIPAVLLRSGAY